MKIVMISGKQGSGKSTISDHLAEAWFELHHKNRCTQIKFADVLYEMHDAVLGILYKYVPPRDIIKDGPLLQLLGAEWGRKTLGENIWVDIMLSKIAKILEDCEPIMRDHGLIIIDDCRFKNELESIPDALKIRLECYRDARKARCSMWRENEMHPSEIDLDDWVYVPGKFDMILNTNIESVNESVSKIMNALTLGDWINRRDAVNKTLVEVQNYIANADNSDHLGIP